MIFVLIFVTGMLVIPVMIDTEKHGSNNIFRRSGRDFLEYELVSSSLRFLCSSALPDFSVSLMTAFSNIFKIVITVGIIVLCFIFVLWLFSFILSSYLIKALGVVAVIGVAYLYFNQAKIK